MRITLPAAVLYQALKSWDSGAQQESSYFFLTKNLKKVNSFQGKRVYTRERTQEELHADHTQACIAEFTKRAERLQ